MQLQNLSSVQGVKILVQQVQKKQNKQSQPQNSVGIISFQGASGMRSLALARTSSFGSNNLEVKELDGKKVIDDIRGGDTKFSIGKEKTYSISTQRQVSAITENDKLIAKIEASKDFGKEEGIKIGAEVQEKGKAPLTLVVSRPFDDNKKEMLVKLQEPVNLKMEDSSGREAKIQIGFSGRAKEPSFAGNSVQLVPVTCVNPESTNKAINEFINNKAKDLVQTKKMAHVLLSLDKPAKVSRGAYADDIKANDFTSVLLAGGVGSRFINCTPDPDKTNKPKTNVASDYNFIDLAFASITNAGLIKPEELKGSLANVDLSKGLTQESIPENTKTLVVQGSIDQNTAGATVAAIHDKHLADNHLLVSMADNVHNIDYSRAIKAFENNAETGLIVVAQPMKPDETVKKFGLIGVNSESFRGEGKNFQSLADITDFVEKPKDVKIAEHDAVNIQFKDGEENKALASTGIYLINKDVANVMGKLLDPTTMDADKPENKGAIKGMDFGGEFFPIMQKLLNTEGLPNKEKLMDIMVDFEAKTMADDAKKDGNQLSKENAAALIRGEEVPGVTLTENQLGTLDNIKKRNEYIEKNVTDSDMQKLEGLKMKTWIAQDRDANEAVWYDLGNFKDYHNVLEEAAKPDNGWKHFPEKWLEQARQNYDPQTRAVCQTPEAKAQFDQFKQDFNLEGDGQIIVMTRDKK